jgi:hypothetical protein
MNYQEAIKGYTGVIQAYALASRTSEKLCDDAWSVLAREVTSALKNGQTVDQIKDDMKQAEDTWKASTGDTSMPSTYRSAKAVALKAALHGIDLLYTDGSVRGKTAIEKDYKAKEEAVPKAEVEVDPTTDAILKATKALVTLQLYWPLLPASVQNDIIRGFNSTVEK